MQGISEILKKKFGKDLGVRIAKRIREYYGKDSKKCAYTLAYFGIQHTTPSSILFNTFVWEDTPEGHQYWSKIYKQLIAKEHKEKYLPLNKLLIQMPSEYYS